MKNKRNYYRVLHVQPDAPIELIRASYRTMMQKMRMHPDLGGDEWDAAVINEAYAVLSDPKQRSNYDKVLFSERSEADATRQEESQRKPSKDQADSRSKSNESNPTQATSYQQSYESNLNGTHQHPSQATACAFCQTPFHGRPAPEANCARCQSPLLVITPQQYEQIDQRSIERIAVNSSLSFYDQWPGSRHIGTLQNLSLNGLQFQSSTLLEIGVRIRIESTKFIAVAQISNQQALTTPQEQRDPSLLYGAQFITLRFLQQSGSFVHIQA